MSKRREERAKLTASFASSVGAGTIVIGVARPALDTSASAPDDLLVMAAAVFAGLAFHLIGRWALRYLD